MIKKTTSRWKSKKSPLLLPWWFNNLRLEVNCEHHSSLIKKKTSVNMLACNYIILFFTKKTLIIAKVVVWSWQFCKAHTCKKETRCGNYCRHTSSLLLQIAAEMRSRKNWLRITIFSQKSAKGTKKLLLSFTSTWTCVLKNRFYFLMRAWSTWLTYSQSQL